jgi:glucosamine 6-phosphate synthetase-like amidotransferase/phosphosugar isomerase protein
VKDEVKVAERLSEIHKNQSYRGKDGAGYVIRRADGQTLRARFRSPDKALKFAERQGFKAGDLVMFHHRFPTSTPNYPAFNHPLSNEDNTLFMVHNGHISNYLELFSKLGETHQFETLIGDEKGKEKAITDSEVILHLLDENIGSEGLVGAFKPMADKVSGSLAIGILAERKIWLFKISNPIVVFSDPEGNTWFASEFPDNKDYTKITELEDGELGFLDATGYNKVQVYEDLKPAPIVYSYDDYDLGSWMSRPSRGYCKFCGEETENGHKYCQWCWENITNGGK